MILSLLGLRQWLVRLMPPSLILAVGSGIGIFIASVSSNRFSIRLKSYPGPVS
jgi:xanthine/uracil/vitamin C permease (AzgA family)